MIKLENIYESYPEETFLTMDGHDNAVLGVEESTLKICYSMKKIIENLMNDMSEEDAMEFYYFNIVGSYVGEKTPIFVNDYDAE